MIHEKPILIAALLGAIAVASAMLAYGSAGFAAFIEWKDVCFPHEMHVADLEIACESCHHETDAAALKTPHPKYFEDFWIECTTCHKPQGAATASMACSSCHHDSPTNLADETLGSKVVIHQSCWNCHEVGSGAAASRSCSSCHNGKHHHPIPEEERKEASKP